MAKQGRPTRCTKELQDNLVNYLVQGNYLETACDLVGIKVAVVRRWIYAGVRGNPKYKNFSVAIKKAMAESEASLLDIVRKAAQEGAWQAAAWRLERKFPDKWGRWQRPGVEVEGDIKKVKLVAYDPEGDNEERA